MNVLIVDDETEITSMLEEEIEGRFMCHVDVASNGLDAFIYCQKQKYDLIITDHVMPIMKGSALIIGLRTRDNLNTETPIIMATAYSTTGLESIPQLEGVIFMNKPFNMEEMFRKMESFLA